MNASPQPLHGRPKAQIVACWLAVLSLCAVFTVGAAKAFPIWDDGWLWLLLEEKGTEAIVPSHPERPVTVALWSLLGPSPSALWRNALVAQALGWPLLALLAARLWRRLYPDLERLAPVVGLVAIAPFVTKMQMVTANVTLTSLPSVLLGYLGLLLAFRFTVERGPKAAAWLVAGLVALAGGVLLQEYAVPVGAAGVILLTHRWLVGLRSTTGRRSALAAAAVAVTVAGSYWAYVRLADFDVTTARQALNPQRFLVLGEMVERLWGELPRAIGEGVVGGFLRSGHALLDAGSSLPAALAAGAFIAALLAWGTSETSVDKTPARVGAMRWDWLALLVALIAALAPPILAGQPPWELNDGISSRFGIPALPILAALVVRLAVVPWRRRARWIPVAVLSAVAGAVAMHEVSAAIEERQRVARMSDCVLPVIEASEGIAVVAVESTQRALGPPRPWELAARLAGDGGDGLSRRLWAHRMGGGPPLRYREEASRLFGRREKCRGAARIRRGVRNLSRAGKRGPLLWVGELEDHSILVESYCRPEGVEPKIRATCPFEPSEEASEGEPLP